MKHRNKLAFVIASMCSMQLYAECNITDSSLLEATNKTFLAIHPLFVSQQPEMVSGFRSDRNQMREDGHGGAFQAVLFGGSTSDAKDLGRYFSIDGKEVLKVAEVGPVAGQIGFGMQDILAQDFNIFTVNGDFESTIMFRPQQSVVGLGLHERHAFWKNHERERGFWLSGSTSIQHVKNDMNLTEFIIENGGGTLDTANNVVVANMEQAFAQADWQYGKICANSSMKRTGLADIEFKVGYEWLQHHPAHTETYLGIIIPTGNRNNGEYVFEPIVGRGKYWGAMFGSSLGLQIWNSEDGDKDIRYELTNHTEVLLNRKQKRSFDLKHRPWSRYLPVYASQADAAAAADLAATNPLYAQNMATPGINVFTQEVKVTPGITTDINMAFVFTCRRFQAEAGYNFLAKRAEKVELDCPWEPVVALKHFLGDGQTNPIRTISGNPYYEQIVSSITPPVPASVPPTPGILLIPVQLNKYNSALIQAADLDLNSAATPAILTNTIYATLGFHLYEREYPLFGNVGASYTFAKNNDAVPRRWVLWAKMGVSF
jgi:hypothetical protein